MSFENEDLSFTFKFSASDSISQLDNLSRSLLRIKSSLAAIQTSDTKTAVANINQLGKVSFSAATTENLTAASASFRKLTSSITKMTNISTTKFSNRMGSLMSSLTPLTRKNSALMRVEQNGVSVRKGINALATSVAKFPQISNSLKSLDMNAFADQMLKLSQAIQPLAKELAKIDGETLKAITSLKKLTNGVKTTDTTMTKLSRNPFMTGASITGLIYSLNRISSLLTNFISKSIEYTENVNLFGVALGVDLVNQAEKFINAMDEVFSLNPSQVMRYMGVFQQLNTAMGMVSSQAYTISENFIKLGYDIASLFNISEETAFYKLEAALAGLPKPLRQIGIDITENALSATAAIEAQKAFAAGNEDLAAQLNSSIEQWDRVQKQQIIYLTILRQTTNAQGDFARTIDSPANQLKILQANIDKLSLAIGNLFYATISGILPYANAFVMILTDSVNALATFFDYLAPSASDAASNAATSVDEMGEAVDDLNVSLDDLNSNLISGIDNFNVLNQGSISAASLGFEGLELPDYDNLMDSVKTKAHEIYEALEPISGVLGEIAIAIGAIIALNTISRLSALTQAILAATGAQLSFSAAIYGIGVAIATVALLALFLNLIKRFDDLSVFAQYATVALGFFTGALILVTKITVLKTLLTQWALGLYLVSGAAGVAAASFGALASMAALTFLVMNWEEMNGLQRVIGVLGALTAAALSAALAMGVFHSAWSIGLATAGIVAGIVAVTAAVTSARKSADLSGGLNTVGTSAFTSNLSTPSVSSSYDSVNSGAYSGGTVNPQSLNASEIQISVYNGVKQALAENNNEMTLVIDGKNISDSTIVNDIIIPELRKSKNRGILV